MGKVKKVKVVEHKESEIMLNHDDTDKLREIDERNELGIDGEHGHDDEKEDKSNAWQPRRTMNNLNNINEQDAENNINDNDNDTDIDFNLMAMYQRGFELQLNKMHYASDTAYEQIM